MRNRLGKRLVRSVDLASRRGPLGKKDEMTGSSLRAKVAELFAFHVLPSRNNFCSQALHYVAKSIDSAQMGAVDSLPEVTFII